MIYLLIISTAGFCGYFIGIIANILSADFDDDQGKKKYKNRHILKGNLPYIVITTILLTLAAHHIWGITIYLLFALIFIYALTILTIVDINTQYLPDIITKPLVAIGLLQGYFEVFCDFKSSIIGAACGYLSLWSINALFKIIRHKEGMGGGDFKLLCAIGAWVGWYYLPLVVVLSSIVAVLLAILLFITSNKDITARIPFGPYLSAAGLIALVFGHLMMEEFALYLI